MLERFTGPIPLAKSDFGERPIALAPIGPQAEILFEAGRGAIILFSFRVGDCDNVLRHPVTNVCFRGHKRQLPSISRR